MTQTTSAARSARPIPEGYHTLTAALAIEGAAQAIDFYERVFEATVLGRMLGPDGQTVWHAELRIGDSRLMLSDAMPEMGARGPLALGGSPVTLHVYVEDADAVFQRAVDAGATVVQPLADAFWGDRYGRFRDPFGHEWGVATHIEDVSDEEMNRRAAAFTGSSSS